MAGLVERDVSIRILERLTATGVQYTGVLVLYGTLAQYALLMYYILVLHGTESFFYIWDPMDRFGT